MSGELLKMALIFTGLYLLLLLMEYSVKFTRKIRKHIRIWNMWRKVNKNGRFYKFLVLIGLRSSLSMMLILTEDEVAKIDISKEEHENESL